MKRKMNALKILLVIPFLLTTTSCNQGKEIKPREKFNVLDVPKGFEAIENVKKYEPSRFPGYFRAV